MMLRFVAVPFSVLWDFSLNFFKSSSFSDIFQFLTLLLEEQEANTKRIEN
jgi:hypothetical protein